MAIARILDTASVRIESDTRGGERDARKAGEEFGRQFTRGADGKLRDARGRFVKAGQEAGEEYGREFTERANRETQRNPVRPKIDPIGTDFQRQVRAMVNDITRDTNIKVPLTMGGEKLRAQVAAWIAEIERTLSVEIPTDPAEALEYRRKLAHMVREAERTVRSRIGIDVDVDRSGGVIRRTASRLGLLFGTVFRDASKTTFEGVASSGAGVLSRLGSSIQGMASTAVSSFTSMVGPVGTVLKLIFGIQYAVPAIAAGLTLVGGSAVAAFGAISAAALGLPVLLFSIGAPIAAIALGMDGIKRAAEPVADEFKLLKDVINVTFELTMRPVFEKLQAIFPTLTAGLSETARSVVRVASDLTAIITSESGIENLRVAFAGVSDMIDKSREGLSALFTSLLNVAGTRELYDILGETIGGVAFRFGNMIERVRSSGDLTAALISLRDVLFGVVDMLNVLIEGSIKFFAAAGPGLTDFFASLTEVLSRIDWAKLGESFGGMMERLGKAIQDIPPEKWQELADAIGGLSEKFIKMVEEGTFIDFIEAITGIANVLYYLKAALDGIEDGLNGLSDMLDGAGQSIYDNVTSPFYHAVADLFSFLGIGSPAQKFIDIGWAIIQGILAGLAAGPQLVFNAIRLLATKALEAMADAGTFLKDKGSQFVEGVKNGISERLDSARAKAVEIKDRIKAALNDAKEWLKQTGRDLVEGFISGIGGKIEDAARKAGEMARRAWEAARNFIQPGSPSKLFARLGRDTIQGYIVGIQDRIAPLIEQVKAIFAQAVAAARSSGAFDLGLGALGINGQATANAVGSGSSTTVDLAAITEALGAVFNSAEWKLNGTDIAMVSNWGNVQLARR